MTRNFFDKTTCLRLLAFYAGKIHPLSKKKEKWRNKLQIDSVRLSSVITSETRRDGMKTEAKRVKSGRVKKEEQGGEKS
jgi:hypothetical protein